MALRSGERGVRRHEWRLALSAAVIGLAAVAGALGLVSGSLDLGATINRRLLFESPVLAGVGLSVVVGFPMMVAAVQCWRGRRRAELMATGAGVLLMGWIMVEIAVIRVFSPLQPILFVAGAAVAFAAFRHPHPIGHRPWRGRRA